MSQERDLTPEMAAEIEADLLYPFWAVFADFPSEEIRFWSGVGDLTFGGNTYTGVGRLVSVGEVSETVESAARGITVSLSGIPSDILAKVDLEEYQGQTVDLYLGCLRAAAGAYEVVADPHLIFRGDMDTDSVRDDGETASIEIHAENRLATLLARREYRCTEESHHALHGTATDRFFQFVPALQDVQIKWGEQP